MSKIEELIKEYCLDGVEYKKLDDVTTYERPDKFIVKNTEYNDAFKIPVLTAGKAFILGYTDETENIYLASAEEPVIIFDDFLAVSKWVDFPFKVKSSAMKFIHATDDIDIRYLFYTMQCINYTPTDHARQWISTYSQFEIPVPPLPVQQEIVRILDSFTELQNELQKELEERKSQIRLLLNSMMQFPMAEEKPIGELLSVCRGASPRPISKYIVPSGIHWIKIGDVKPGEKYITDTEQFVSQDGAKKSRLVKPGDLIMSNSMSYGRPYIMKISGCIHDGWLLVSNYEDSYTTEFLYYLLRSDRVQKQFSKKASSGTVSNLNADIVRSVQVPVPTFEEQNAIVEKLSIFDEYNTAVKKEIMFRQQQYTYYRDKLLSFPRKEV